MNLTCRVLIADPVGSRLEVAGEMGADRPIDVINQDLLKVRTFSQIDILNNVTNQNITKGMFICYQIDRMINVTTQYLTKVRDSNKQFNQCQQQGPTQRQRLSDRQIDLCHQSGSNPCQKLSLW